MAKKERAPKLTKHELNSILDGMFAKHGPLKVMNPDGTITVVKDRKTSAKTSAIP